jgi:hypothetical protein
MRRNVEIEESSRCSATPDLILVSSEGKTLPKWPNWMPNQVLGEVGNHM